MGSCSEYGVVRSLYVIYVLLCVERVTVELYHPFLASYALPRPYTPFTLVAKIPTANPRKMQE